MEPEGRHVASLTHSDMIMLNLEELQAMGAFRLEVVLLDKQEAKMHAYNYG